MVKLTKLMKAIIGAAILNKAVRGALIAMLMGLINRTMRPSASSMSGRSNGNHRPDGLQALLESVLASVLLNPAKGSGNRQQEATSTIGVLLTTLMRSMEGQPTGGYRDNKERIIETDDYTIINEK